MKSREEFVELSQNISIPICYTFFALSREISREGIKITQHDRTVAKTVYMGCCWCGKVNENERFKQIAVKVFNGLFLIYRKA
jgi:hypothetical protein